LEEKAEKDVGTPCRIWLADLTYTGQDTQSLGADTFPLAIGCIATYTESQIKFQYPIQLFRYPEKLATALTCEGAPDVMGFSNFVWNSELSLAMARRIKELNPKTIVVMGGANYPLENKKREEFLRDHPQIDFYISHEGEIAFTALIRNLISVGMDKNKTDRKLLSVHRLDESGKLLLPPGEAERIKDLSIIPSPYTTGKFDEFFDGRLWPLIQTKRGCPFSCTFCVEGLEYYSKIGRFSVSLVEKEIEYIGLKMQKVHAAGGRNDLYIADSNFGMFKEDLDACRALKRSKDLYGWPDYINTSTGKNRKERVLEAARIVDGSIVLSGSVQSLNQDVLENIKRKNISADELMLLAKEADNVDANSYCEVILGLPGETKKSHIDTLATAVEAGFNKVIPYQLMILGGSELGTEATLAKYQMSVRYRVLPRAFGAYGVCGKRIISADIETTCVATSTMSYEDYLDSRMMHLIVTIFYNDVVFETVMRALRVQKLGIFRWLELLQQSIPDSKLEAVCKDFRDHTDKELWRDRKELLNFIQEPGVIERYTHGELGYNLLHTFKARALVGHLDGVGEVAQAAIKRLLEENTISDPTVIEFFETAIQWDISRMQDIVYNMDRETSGTMQFDIPRFIGDADREAAQEFSSYRYDVPRIFRYILTEEQKDYICRNLMIFGDNHPGIGRLFSTAYTRKMLRVPTLTS